MNHPTVGTPDQADLDVMLLDGFADLSKTIAAHAVLSSYRPGVVAFRSDILTLARKHVEKTIESTRASDRVEPHWEGSLR